MKKLIKAALLAAALLLNYGQALSVAAISPVVATSPYFSINTSHR